MSIWIIFKLFKPKYSNLNNWLSVRLQNAANQLTIQNTVKVDPLFLAYGHNFTIGWDHDLTWFAAINIISSIVSSNDYICIL